MSRSGILDALRNEERSLRSQLVAIQRATEAIEGNVPPAAGRGRKKAVKAVGRRKRAMSEEQRRAVAERMRKYWASRREAKQPVVKVPRSRDRRDRSCVLRCLAWRWGQAAVERGKRRCGCPRRICRRVLGTRFTSG